MSLRDYFATHLEAAQVVALSPECAEEFIGLKFPNGYTVKRAEWSFAVEAKLRYMFADAMLEARKVQP